MRYGQFEEMVEEEVGKVCKASSVALQKPIKRACERLMDRWEDNIVSAYFARVTQEDDWNMNWRVCRAMTSSCDATIARLDVPQLDRLEQEAKLAVRERATHARARTQTHR